MLPLQERKAHPLRGTGSCAMLSWPWRPPRAGFVPQAWTGPRPVWNRETCSLWANSDIIPHREQKATGRCERSRSVVGRNWVQSGV